MSSEHEHEFYWRPETNEAGWNCYCGHKPGEPPGFSPELDRSRLELKIESILIHLTESSIVYLSNCEHGEAMTLHVACRCREEKRFDQYSIAFFALDAMQPRHAKYWSEISEGIIAGKDPRDRCACGKLSTSSTLVNGEWSRSCSECWIKSHKEPF